LKTTYPYLQDPRALAEIRKHQWIESQKKGQEVGFATAAVEWITNYGKVWKEIHVKDHDDKSIFLERRKYRRFQLDCAVELIKNDTLYLTDGIDVSFFGLTCRSMEHIPIRCEVDVHLPLDRHSRQRVVYHGTVERVLPLDVHHYQLYICFDDRTQETIGEWQYIRYVGM
jgi:hypothetical protein